jgi:APA family basic amino acid/polyamine antiporter
VTHSTRPDPREPGSLRARRSTRPGADDPVPLRADSALERRLGPLDSAAIIVSNVIGGGIFLTPPLVAALVPVPGLFLSTWIAGGLLAFAGAMAYAELAALRPRAGGEYVYLLAAYGKLAAFLTGWTSFIAGFSGAMAASAVVLASYLGRFFPAAADSTPLLRIPLPFVPLVVSRQSIVALAAIALMAWIHRRGIGPGRLVGNILASLKVLALLMFIAAGLGIGQGSVANLQQSSAAGGTLVAGWLLALIAVMFTYSGWNASAYVAEEIRNPGRNVPLSLALGTVAVVVIYVLLNALFLYAYPIGELSTIKGSVLDVIADRLFPSSATAGNTIALLAVVSIAASISAMTLAGPRVYYAMARDGLFFRQAARVHPRFHTPSVAIIAQAAWAGVLVLSGGAFALINYTGFAVVLFSGLAVAALFVLRRREPAADRPFKVWGYPITPAIFTLASIAILGNALWNDLVRPITAGTDWGPSAAGLIVIAAGLPLYYAFAAARTR